MNPSTTPQHEVGPDDEFERMTNVAKRTIEQRRRFIAEQHDDLSPETSVEVYLAHAFLKYAHSETATSDAKDAARYRWLKSLMKEDSEGWQFPGIRGTPSIETVDQVIDATLESQ